MIALVWRNQDEDVEQVNMPFKPPVGYLAWAFRSREMLAKSLDFVENMG